MELIKNLIDSLASNNFNTCQVLSKFRAKERSRKKAKAQTSNSGPWAREGFIVVPAAFPQDPLPVLPPEQ